MKSNSGKQIKRSISPIAPQTIESSQRKKKSFSNNIHAKALKQFQSYGKPDKKKQTIHNNRQYIITNQQKNKYRIVTEPVDDRIMHLTKANIFSNSLVRLPASRKKLQTEIAEPHIKFTIKSSNHSKEKIKVIQCHQCQKYRQDIDSLKNEMFRVFQSKNKWKNSQKILLQIKQQYGVESKNLFSNAAKPFQAIINQTKKNMYELMKDIECLASIDYAKMLSLEIFNYEPSSNLNSDHQYKQIQSLIDQLRQNISGRVTSEDFEGIQNNERVTSMIRNLKLRLSNCLRQNIQLRLKKNILGKSQDSLSPDSEDELKRIIEQVLMSYQKNSKVF